MGVAGGSARIALMQDRTASSVFILQLLTCIYHYTPSRTSITSKTITSQTSREVSSRNSNPSSSASMSNDHDMIVVDSKSRSKNAKSNEKENGKVL